MADNNNNNRCNTCAKTGSDPDVNLKSCAKCKGASYCSRECQKKDWKEHKKTCSSKGAEPTPTASNASNASTNPRAPTTAKGLSANIEKPFHKLHGKTWLHDRPEKDVYKLLIDVYRMRMEDNYKLEGEVDEDSVYSGNDTDGQVGFQRFLERAKSRAGLLPSWWSPQKASACMALGTDNPRSWTSLRTPIEKSDVTEHYGNPLMPMQLRMLGEQVYGRGPGGQDGAMMMKMQMMQEKEGNSSSTAHLDMSSMFSR